MILHDFVCFCCCFNVIRLSHANADETKNRWEADNRIYAYIYIQTYTHITNKNETQEEEEIEAKCIIVFLYAIF